MNIENPISTVRKAVQGSAETIAEKEFKNIPEDEHYKEAINSFRYLKVFEPQRYAEIIKIGAKAKELKDEMGLSNYKIFDEVIKEVISKDEPKMHSATEKIKSTSRSDSEQKQKLYELNERFLNIKAEEIKSDPRIIKAFEGREDLVVQTLNFCFSNVLSMLKNYEPEILTDLPTGAEERLGAKKDTVLSKIVKFFRSIE